MKAPTLEQIQHYCLSRRNGIDAEAFLNHYEMVGWVCGRNRLPMKDWKAAVRLWERNQKQWSKQDTEQEFINKHTERGWAE